MVGQATRNKSDPSASYTPQVLRGRSVTTNKPWIVTPLGVISIPPRQLQLLSPLPYLPQHHPTLLAANRAVATGLSTLTVDRVSEIRHHGAVLLRSSLQLYRLHVLFPQHATVEDQRSQLQVTPVTRRGMRLTSATLGANPRWKSEPNSQFNRAASPTSTSLRTNRPQNCSLSRRSDAPSARSPYRKP